MNSYPIEGREPCRGLGEMLTSYLDNELDDDARRFVEEHLSGCLRCGTELAELRQVKRFLASTSPFSPPLPAGLTERVRAQTYKSASRLAAPRIRPGRVIASSWPRVFALAAGGVLLLLLALGALSALSANPFAPSPVAAATLASLEDHAMCERLNQVPQSLPGDSASVRAQLASALGMSVGAPSELPASYRFAGGRAFRAAGTTSAHLAWVEGNHMLSFYQSADPGGNPPTGWRKVQVDGRAFWLGASGTEGAVLWRDGGVLYLLAGTRPETDLLRIAASVNTQGQ